MSVDGVASPRSLVVGGGECLWARAEPGVVDEVWVVLACVDEAPPCAVDPGIGLALWLGWIAYPFVG